MEYDFEVIYRAAAKHQVADALFRLHKTATVDSANEAEIPTMIISTRVRTKLKEAIGPFLQPIHNRVNEQ